MNKKGLLFTVMTLFLGVTLLSSIIALEDISRNSFSIKEIAGITLISGRFNNISNQLIDFDKEGYSKSVSERTLPFSYQLNKDQNSITITQQFPFSQTKYDAFFDATNIASIFLEDQNRVHAYDGLIVDVNTPKNSSWGGSFTSINFLINPFCYEYIVQSSKNTLFSKSTSNKCDSTFSSSSIRRIDINILVNSGEDYNSILCNGTTCPQDSFNSSNSNPYYKINIIDTNCTLCNLPSKTSSSHFSTSSNFNVIISCSGIGCVSQPITIDQSSLDFNISHPLGKTKNIISTITFNDSPTGFIAKDINLAISTEAGGYSKSTQ